MENRVALLEESVYELEKKVLNLMLTQDKLVRTISLIPKLIEEKMYGS